MDLYIFLGIVAVIVLWALSTYNRFVRLTTQATEGFADIDVQLKRRYDLIPNLVEVVKGYAKHEQGTLDAVIKARNSAMQGGGSLQDKAQNENMLSNSLKSIFALSESYPDLKANQNFLELQRELSDTEDKIQAARRFYNGMVRDLSILVDSVPSNIIAKFFSFGKKEFFDLEGTPEARENVKVAF